MSTVTTPRRRHIGRIVGVVIALVVFLVILLWDWNWFKPMVESQASSALNRKVTIGKLDVKLRWHPWIILDDTVVTNPPEMTEGSLASVGRLSVHINPWALLHGKVVLPDLIIDRLRGDLRPTPSGKGNWVLDKKPAGKPDEKPDEKPAVPEKPPMSIDIGRLAIIDGSAHVLDPEHKSDFAILLHTDPSEDPNEPNIVVTTEGTYSNAPITAKLVGGSLLFLRDPSHPYKIDLTAANGRTTISLHGTLLDPLRFGGANVSLEFKGDDLAQLYQLTGVPLPETAAYMLTGKLDYEDGRIRFTGSHGTVGNSDLNGDWFYVPRPERPDVTANLYSKQVLMADLAGFIGATPGKPGSANDTAKTKAERSKQEAKPSLLPDQPINLPKLRSADLHVSYKAQHIETPNTPLDDIVAVFDVVDGKVDVHPLSFGVGTGSISTNIKLDGQQDRVHAIADVDFRKVDLSHILTKTSAFKGTGVIGGDAKLNVTGNSVKTMLGNGDGNLKLYMTGGDVSAILLDLAGIDLGNALLSAVGVPNRTELRCMIVDMDLKDGQVKTNTLLVDTTEANLIGSGSIDLTAEKIDYTLKTQPKHINIGSISAPILIKGPLKSPSIGLDPTTLAVKGAAAVVLGVFLTPVAALIPTIQLGLGKDNNCTAMLSEVGASAGATPSTSVKFDPKAATPEATPSKKAAGKPGKKMPARKHPRR